MGDSNPVLRLRGYRGPGRPRKYDSEDEKRIARKVERRVLPAAARLQRNVTPHTEDSTNLQPLNILQRASALCSPPPLSLATPERMRRGPGRPRKYETAEERRMARTFQTRARRERNRLAMQERLQNHSPVKQEENDHDSDRGNGPPNGAASASVHPTRTTPMTFPRGLEPTLSPSPASPPSKRHSHALTSGPHSTKGASGTRSDPPFTNTASPMSFQWILHPSDDGSESKSVPTAPLTRSGAGPRALRSTPFVQISSSSEPRDSAALFSTRPVPSTDLPTTGNSSTGIRVSRPIPSPMRASTSKDKPSASNSTPPFPLTSHPPITNLHDALAEVDRLRERCRLSFEYIDILESANESLRMKLTTNGVTST